MAVVMNHLVQMRASRVQLPAVTLRRSQILNLMWTLDLSSSAAYLSGILTEKRQIGSHRMNICCGIQASASSVQMLKVIWQSPFVCPLCMPITTGPTTLHWSLHWVCHYHWSRMLCLPVSFLETLVIKIYRSVIVACFMFVWNGVECGQRVFKSRALRRWASEGGSKRKLVKIP